jgi:NodT family efflux transporter outer membrane factor (OMF) lipoprotein
LFPQLDGFAGVEQFEGDDVDDGTFVFLGLSASYEVDLWGRIESSVEAEQLRAAATQADYQTAAISLSAEVALTWYQLATARLQLKLIESQLETNLKVLDVLEKRFAVGQSGSADVLRQRQLAESSREQIVVAQSAIAVLEHQLAVLEGRPPQAKMDLPFPALPALPDTPATGLPAELLQRRPDVLAAFLQLEAADKEVAAAVSDQYPRINLSASLLTSAQSASDLFSAWLLSLAGQVTAPLFDGGQRRAEVERTVAVRRQRLAEYGQTVLVAFREVEDSLVLEQDQIERIRILEQQLVLANSTYQQLRNQYLNGAADFLDVLAALREQQQIERSLLTAKLDRVAFRIALYRALAGGFQTPREATEMISDVAEIAGDAGEPNRG